MSLKKTLKYLFRNYSRNPIYSMITFVGFTLGIAAGLFIYLWVFNELSYDKSHLDYERIYRVLTLSKQGDKVEKSAGCYRPLAALLKQDYPQIEYATYLSYDSEDSPLQRKEGTEKIEARGIWTNNDFFSIFNGFVFTEGNAADAVQRPDCIILSEKVARKLFGSAPALGQTVISDKYTKEVYTVGGVVRIPERSHIDFGYILTERNLVVSRYASSWGDKSLVHVYIKLRKDALIDATFLKQVTNQVTRYSGKTDKLLFQPLTGIHLHSDYAPGYYDKNISNVKYIWIFSGLAVLIVLMASFNFAVLSVARVSERASEIGIKKVNGASQCQILLQFMGESVSQTFAAAITALLLVRLSLPFFNHLTGAGMQLDFSAELLSNLLFFTLLTGVLAGTYPSFYLSSLSPNGIFRGGSVSGSQAGFIRTLVAVQFSIAIFFIIATFVFVKQLNYVRTKDLGMNHQNVVVIPTGLWYDCKAFKDELLKNPNILSVSASAYAPVDFGWKTTFPVNNQGMADSLTASLFWVDEDFARTYQLEIIKGKFLSMDYNAYWKEREKKGKNNDEEKDHAVSIPVVINQTAEKMLGFNDPVGQRLGNDKVIVGVVKDFNFQTLYHPIGPVVLLNNPENIMTMNVKIAPNNKAETLKYIRDVYQKDRDQRGFTYNFFDDLMNEKYSQDMRLRNITILFSVLAIVISVLGILGMAVFSTDRRVKEIGIRKVNGAKVSEILAMLNKDFIKWVFIAFLVAAPTAFYTLHKWQENFAYKTIMSWWIFALAGLLALGIALLTVSWQSWKAATRNPVDALKYE